MSASLAVICHRLDEELDYTTCQLLNGITSVGVEACLYSSHDVIKNIDDFEQFNGFVFEASSSQELDQIVDAFNGAAAVKNESGLWRNKLAAGFTQGVRSEFQSLRAMMDFSFFCNSQNMVWLSSGNMLQRGREAEPTLGNAPVLDEIPSQAYRHGQYLAYVAKRWQPDN